MAREFRLDTSTRLAERYLHGFGWRGLRCRSRGGSKIYCSVDRSRAWLYVAVNKTTLFLHHRELGDDPLKQEACGSRGNWENASESGASPRSAPAGWPGLFFDEASRLPFLRAEPTILSFFADGFGRGACSSAGFREIRVGNPRALRRVAKKEGGGSESRKLVPKLSVLGASASGTAVKRINHPCPPLMTGSRFCR